MLPTETAAAFFPSAAKAHGATMRPITPASATALEVFGVDIREGANAQNALVAAWVLSLSHAELKVAVADAEYAKRSFKAWSSRLDGDARAEDMARVVNAELDAAFATYVKPSDGGEKKTRTLAPSGFGWSLEIAEALCAEYGWPFDRAASTPLVTAYALMACANRRCGDTGALDYYDRITAAKVASIKAAMAASGGNDGRI